MTTFVSTRSPGTLNATRQQLDELDALLQRMLELPVNNLDDAEQEEIEEPAEEPTLSVPTPEEPPADTEDWSSTLQPDNNGRIYLGTRPATPAVSYMVVETASPRPLPLASGFEPRPSFLTPRESESGETPVPPEDRSGETPISPELLPPELLPPELLPAELRPLDETPVSSNEEEMWVPLRSTWQPSAQTWQPLAESWHQAHGAPPIPEVMPSPIPTPRLELPLLDDVSQPSPENQRAEPDAPPATPDPSAITPAPAAAEPQVPPATEDASADVPRLLLPLLWFNQGFDACLAPLGAPGRWLCGRRGRLTLGLVGLTCLAAAAAIGVSARMGWTW